MKRSFAWVGLLVVLLALGIMALAYRDTTASPRYGVSFSSLYAEEIGLDWKAVYREMLDDLGVRLIRIPVYWSEVEPQEGVHMWDDLDYQLREAAARDARLVLALGRRVPRWPECHVPRWAQERDWEAQKSALREFITAVVLRYRDEEVVALWQVENEPFLESFGDEQCGDELDTAFLDEEIALVRSLDPSRPIMLTDSGNLGMWAGAYRRADIFGTSAYLYFWEAPVGAFRTILPPGYYRLKANVMKILFGERPLMISELSLEPWLAAHIDTVPLEEQLRRMNIEKFYEILDYGRRIGFPEQYLWGVEWWYYMREKHGHPEFWDAAKRLYRVVQ